MKRIFSLAFILPAVSALAQQPGGVFKATLDGKPLTCQVWPMQSDFLRTGSSQTVSMIANRCEWVRSC